MTVVAIVTKAPEAAPMGRWAAHFARASGADVVLVHPAQRRGEPSVREVDPHAEDPDRDDVVEAICAFAREHGAPPAESRPERGGEAGTDDADGEDAEPGPEERAEDEAALEVRVVEAHAPEELEAMSAVLAELKPSLLVIPRDAPLRGRSAESSMERELYYGASCETIALRLSGASGERCARVLVPVAEGPHAEVALRLGAELAERAGGSATALFVQTDKSEEAEPLGERMLERVVSRAAGRNAEHVERKVVLRQDVRAAIAEEAESGYDLVVMGASDVGAMRRMLFGTVSEKLLARWDGPAVAIVRRSVPLGTRVQTAVGALVRRFAPQLERPERIELVEGVQASSRLSFDYLALVALSTSIASLGLVRDSAAVVIGAMLVAPLMTPHVGAGLALVQGNLVMFRGAARSIAAGFVLALGIAWIAGAACLDPFEATGEMEARGSPHVLDLLVALVSGMAAAYAMARPNLSAALPGVAIAAALLPPVATSGLALAAARLDLALGAGLLFAANFLAIVLGASVSLTVVGIRTSRAERRTEAWVRDVSLVLIFVTVGLAISLGREVGATSETAGIPDALVTELDRRIAELPQAERSRLARLPGVPRATLELVLDAPVPPDRAWVDDAARAARELFGEPVELIVRTRVTHRASASGPGRRPDQDPAGRDGPARSVRGTE